MCSAEVEYKVKAVVGVQGMLRPNMRYTEPLRVSPNVELERCFTQTAVR